MATPAEDSETDNVRAMREVSPPELRQATAAWPQLLVEVIDDRTS
jgi:hypothetical protein